ncbi:hypothetical protein ERJ75_000152300 [Trypanosoma vivax]|nr:hypothetical protein ERJ75_000152300 [Trypanosoma vivax]
MHPSSLRSPSQNAECQSSSGARGLCAFLVWTRSTRWCVGIRRRHASLRIVLSSALFFRDGQPCGGLPPTLVGVRFCRPNAGHAAFGARGDCATLRSKACCVALWPLASRTAARGGLSSGPARGRAERRYAGRQTRGTAAAPRKDTGVWVALRPPSAHTSDDVRDAHERPRALQPHGGRRLTAHGRANRGNDNRMCCAAG